MLAAFAAAAPAAAESPEPPPDPLPLSWCIDRAASRNPSLAASAADAEAARQRVVPAGALEDPRFGYEASNLLASLEHKNIVNTLGAFKTDENFFLVQEYLSGGWGIEGNLVPDTSPL